MLKEKSEFTLVESSQTIGSNLEAMVYFNLAKQGIKEGSDGYKKAKTEEIEYLNGIW